MPTRSYEPAPQAKLFGRRRPLHAALGGGKLADILLWKDKKLSYEVLSGISMIWFLFEVVEYPFVTLLCHVVMLIMLILFGWHNAAGLITWRPPNIYDFEISEYTFRYIYSVFNLCLRKFYEISTGKDLGLFFVTIAGLWIMSAIGSIFTVLNLLYIIFLGILILTPMYERYENEVDYMASKGSEDVRGLFKKLDSKILTKIPRAPGREKKYR